MNDDFCGNIKDLHNEKNQLQKEIYKKEYEFKTILNSKELDYKLGIEIKDKIISDLKKV